MENLDLGTLIPVISTALIALFGGLFAKFKGKFSKIVKLIKEVYDIAYAFELALQDDKITKKEIEGLRSDFAELKKSYKDLIK